MIRSILLLYGLALALTCVAQTDTSLTKEFAQLSAKERSRIALREQEEAAHDTGFQTLMAEAEKLFQQQRYDDALAMFEQARKARPYNVHPKVKIHDLQVLIKKRSEAKALEEERPREQHEPMPPDRDLQEEVPSSPVLMYKPMEPSPKKAEFHPDNRPGPERELIVQVESVPARAHSEGPPPKRIHVPGVLPPAQVVAQAPIIGERIFKEGGAVVVERVIEQDGRVTTFRKVSQAWGHCVYFQNGAAITPHAWEEVFGDQ